MWVLWSRVPHHRTLKKFNPALHGCLRGPTNLAKREPSPSLTTHLRRPARPPSTHVVPGYSPHAHAHAMSMSMCRGNCQAVLFPLLYLKFGLLPDLFVSAIFGGGSAGLLALRDDAVGKFARDAVGGTTNLALSNFVMRAEEINDEYQVTRDAQERLSRQIDQLAELQEKVAERSKRG